MPTFPSAFTGKPPVDLQPANDNYPIRGYLFAPTDNELSRISLVERLGLALGNLDTSRRGIPDFITDAIFLTDFEIIWPSGEPFITLDLEVDDCFGSASMKCISELIKGGLNGRKQRPRLETLPRLRLLVLAFMVQYPEIARHFFI